MNESFKYEEENIVKDKDLTLDFLLDFLTPDFLACRSRRIRLNLEAKTNDDS